MESNSASFNERHLELVDLASEIGLIAEMPSWATARMESMIESDKDLKELTLGELISLSNETATYINKTLS
jgi:hypothetical protein